MQLPPFDPSLPLSIRTVRELSGLAAEQVDALPIGVIRTDLEGIVLAYNAAESAISGMPAAEVIGKNFFTEIAPCTNVQEFAGRFRHGIAAGGVHESFPYTFEFEPKDVRVLITIFYAHPDEFAWIFVSTLPKAD